MFSVKWTKENTPGRNVGKLSYWMLGVPARSNLNKGKGWPPECDYSSTLGAEVICYVIEKPMPSPTPLPIVWPGLIYMWQVWGRSLSAASRHELTSIVLEVVHRHEKCRHVYEKELPTNCFCHLNPIAYLRSPREFNRVMIVHNPDASAACLRNLRK